jgi:predicted nucleic acid-binding protein
MSGSNFLADTNAIIYILEGKGYMLPFLLNITGISVISEIELRGLYQISINDENEIKYLLENLEICPLSDPVKELAINLKQNYKIKLPDAIIAATAIKRNLTLLTADKDFAKIKELELVLIEL